MESFTTHALAQFVARVQYSDLPAAVVHETKRIFLDVLGCAVGSVDLDKGRIAIRFVRENAGTGPGATILGTGETAPPALAAFANAELMHATDHCPILPPAHIAPFVTAAPLALAEVNGVTGKDLLTALALAHEVASRVGLALDPMRVATGDPVARVWGLSFDSFGAAAGAAKVLNLTETQALDALGLAGCFAPMPSHNKFLMTPAGGGMAKYGPAGWTSQGGVTAALLAALGYRGDRSILDGPYGFWAMVGSKSFNTEVITTGLGEAWKILRVMYKRWPCAGNLQSPLGAFTALVEENSIQAHEIEGIKIYNESQNFLPRFQYDDVNHNVDTQTNLAYNIAIAAHRVPISSAWQSERYLTSESVRTLMKKVEIVLDARADVARHRELVVEKRSYIERRPCRVELVTRGSTFVAEADHAFWLSMDNPKYIATDADLVAKFTANASATLPPGKIASAIGKIMRLEELSNVRTLLDDLRP